MKTRDEQIAEMYRRENDKLKEKLEEAVRCLQHAIKFVYHYYGDDKEALADMETSTWRIFVRDNQ